MKKVVVLASCFVLAMVVGCSGEIEYSSTPSEVSTEDVVARVIVGNFTVFKVVVDGRSYLVSSRGGIVFHSEDQVKAGD